MRNVIITIALVFICAVILVGQSNVNEMEREGYKVKYLADNMANAATIEIDLAEYSYGRIIFDYDAGNALALQILQDSGDYDAAYKSIGDYFTEDAVVDIYYFDQSLECKHYQNGILKGTMAFDFDGRKIKEWIPDLDKIEDALDYPCACVVYNAGKPRMNLAITSSLVKVQKMSVYEYKH